MPDYVDEDVLLREIYPELSESERTEVKEFLTAYCTIILRMCEREERERRESFDDPSGDR
jgi:hypothetical protein